MTNVTFLIFARMEASTVNNYFHGTIPVDISYVSQSIASGTIYNVTTFETCHLVIIYLPDFNISNFKVLAASKYIDEDDSKCKGAFRVSNRNLSYFVSV